MKVLMFALYLALISSVPAVIQEYALSTTSMQRAVQCGVTLRRRTLITSPSGQHVASPLTASGAQWEWGRGSRPSFE